MSKLNIQEVLQYLPHRYPFMLVDRVLELEKGESIVALKNVTYNEPFFPGHFPKKPVMPGVIIVEALAQAAGILTLISNNIGPNHDEMFYFAGIDNVRFRRIVEPGDQLILHASIERNKKTVYKFNAKAMVGDELACCADLMLAR
ncbi:MAG: 3-hydroxyacyl-ACP dehydratase FabZ [Gammaproteobacteria bacterium]|nr:3-hydroxyacyl-ACP dehydratase FabZ [Gammaproteobacteria bacterium]